jgi:hypothetical protein
VHAPLSQKFLHARHECHVSTAQEADSQPVDILVERGLDDGFGCQPHAGMNDVESRVAKSSGDDSDSSIVTVQSDF